MMYLFFCCNIFNVVISATWGGGGYNLRIGLYPYFREYVRCKYTNTNFIKGMDFICLCYSNPTFRKVCTIYNIALDK